MSKITIIRPNSWISRATINNIYIGGEKVGTVTAGEKMYFDVAPGKHTVVLKNAYAGGSRLIEVEVDMDENKILQLSPVKYLHLIHSFSPVIAAIFSALIINIFNVDIKGLYLMIVLLLLYLFFYFTFGRSRLWKIDED